MDSGRPLRAPEKERGRPLFSGDLLQGRTIESGKSPFEDPEAKGTDPRVRRI